MHTPKAGIITGLVLALLAAGCGANGTRDEVARLKREKQILKADFQGYIARQKQMIDKLKKENEQLKRRPYKKETDFLKLQGIPGVQERDGEVVVLMTADILFDPGSAVLKPSAKRVLRKLAHALQNDLFKGKPIRIEGHTDADPIRRARKRFKSNWELGAARAQAVLDYLVKYGGLDPAKRTIYTASFSKYKPVASNKTKAGKAQNRRVEVVVVMGRK